MENTKLSAAARDAIRGALVSRGVNKGRLKAQCPRMGTPAAAAWQALIANSNPYKMGLGHIMFFGPESRALFNEVNAWCEGLSHKRRALVAMLDRDRAALESMGAW